MKTREELIDEMAKAIYATGVALDGTDYAFGVYDDDDHFHRMASALIAAGIGDVSWWERKCKLCEEDWFLQKKQIEHYAESYKELLQEDLDKYKHRAEVAEKDLERHKRALSCACYDKARTYSPNDDWREVAKKFEHDYLQQSEKELVEEKKDD